MHLRMHNNGFDILVKLQIANIHKNAKKRVLSVQHEFGVHNFIEVLFKVFPDGLMDDMTSKNISSCTVSYTALPVKIDLHFQPTLS